MPATNTPAKTPAVSIAITRAGDASTGDIQITTSTTSAEVTPRPGLQPRKDPTMTTTTTRKSRSSARTTPAPAPLTPEQIEAKARREAAADAYAAAREDLLTRAQAIAEKLHPGRVYLHSIGDCFSVMFGDNSAPRMTFAGPGVVELGVELSTWSLPQGSDEFDPPSLRFLPRAYSLSCSDGLDGAEAQGRALIEAAGFARTLLALLA